MNQRDADGDVVRHLRAADAGLTAVWKWLLVGVQLITFGGLAGIYIANSRAMSDSITALSNRVQAFTERMDTVILDQNTQKLKLQALTDDVRRLEGDQGQLQQQLNTMRDMREAYVYSQAMRAGGKSSQKPIAP